MSRLLRLVLALSLLLTPLVDIGRPVQTAPANTINHVLSNAFNFSQHPGDAPANVPNQLPNTGGRTLPLLITLASMALLIAVSSLLRRRARRA